MTLGAGWVITLRSAPRTRPAGFVTTTDHKDVRFVHLCDATLSLIDWPTPVPSARPSVFRPPTGASAGRTAVSETYSNQFSMTRSPRLHHAVLFSGAHTQGP
ncbi:hypothetical protein AT728_10605 [Streptomyces silvensis]|uniref:Uncharacterized protein n=1 Tax=Streptomyces silvensis TaxID=1765722 RepID=A0A0W7X4X7_9ACTN|nr:hypothetical protein AT728_10605 [Streptomyces silvensis]